MQIYEVFQANENVLKGVANSVKSAVSRAPAIAGAVASDIGSRILSRAGLPGDVGLGTDNAFGDKEAQAARTAEPLIKAQADNLFKQWAANKDRSNPTALKQSLMNMVQNTLLQRKLGRDYTKLDNWVAQDPQTQQRAAALVKNMTTGIDTILKSNPQDTAKTWEDLVRATSQAMSLMTFHPKDYNYAGFSGTQMPTIVPTAQGYNIGTTALNAANPAQQTMIQLIKTQTANGVAPKIVATPQGYKLGSTLLSPNNSTHKKLIDIISGGNAGAQPTTKPTAQPTTEPAAQQSKVGVGQINKLIPTLRTRDLLSVKKNVDTALASKQKKTAVAPAAAKSAAPKTKGTGKGLTKQQRDYIKAINARQPQSVAEQRNAK